MSVVSNTGPLIALAKADRLDLLERLFGQVEIPLAVQRELFAKTPEAARLEIALDRFIQIAPSHVISADLERVTGQLGAGEQQAIALALERKALLLMDDRAGRSAARQLDLAVTGLAGILILAKERELISRVVPLLEEIRERGYWLSDDLIAQTAKRAGEKLE